MRFSKLGLGALGCVIALAGACNKKGTTDNGSGGTVGGATGGVTGGSGTGTTGGTTGSTGGTTGSTGGSMGATGGKGSTAGMSSGAGMSGGAGKSSGAGMSGGAGTTGGGSPTCDGSGAAKTGTCFPNSNGVYAMKVTVDTWWETIGVPGVLQLVDAGRGDVVIYLRAEIAGVCKDGTGGMATVHACGAEIAPFINSGVTMEAYQTIFPDTIWDSPMMPTFSAAVTTSGFNPMDTITLAQAAGLVGISLTDANGSFPTADQTTTFACKDGKKGLDCFPDHDGDGKPGVTVMMKVGGMTPGSPSYAYAGAPTGIDALGPGMGVRATTLQLGLRNTLGGSGQIGADCKSGMGDATAANIDVRAAGCQTKDGECTADQANFLDSNLPVYKILAKGATPTASDVMNKAASKGPQAQIVRLGDPGGTFTCANTRDAFK